VHQDLLEFRVRACDMREMTCLSGLDPPLLRPTGTDRHEPRRRDLALRGGNVAPSRRNQTGSSREVIAPSAADSPRKRPIVSTVSNACGREPLPPPLYLPADQQAYCARGGPDDPARWPAYAMRYVPSDDPETVAQCSARGKRLYEAAVEASAKLVAKKDAEWEQQHPSDQDSRKATKGNSQATRGRGHRPCSTLKPF
jgi:hypothetical protein